MPRSTKTCSSSVAQKRQRGTRASGGLSWRGNGLFTTCLRSGGPAQIAPDLPVGEQLLDVRDAVEARTLEGFGAEVHAAVRLVQLLRALRDRPLRPELRQHALDLGE